MARGLIMHTIQVCVVTLVIVLAIWDATKTP